MTIYGHLEKLGFSCNFGELLDSLTSDVYFRGSLAINNFKSEYYSSNMQI